MRHTCRSWGAPDAECGHHVTLSGSKLVGLISVNSNVTFTALHLAFANGSSGNGGAIFNSGLLTASDCAFTGNSAIGSIASPAVDARGGAIFEIGELTLGKAAEFAGWNRLRFANELSRLKIPIVNLDDEEIEAEPRAIRGSYHHG